MTLEELRAEGVACTRCALAGSRTQVVFGVGNPRAGLMLIGEGPGRDEDLQGEPFVGRSGKLLDRLLAEEMGIDRTGCYIANVLMCRPPGNRDPRPEEIESCRPHLQAKIELMRPRVMITLGNFATRFVLERTEGIKRLRGRVYPYDHGVVVPTYHPSAALRSGGEVLAEMRADLIRAKQALAAPSAPAPAAGPVR
ncbi:MAG TPA: uracil-DNA glycosylase [Acidimicrobiales bacterium]|nr:uracil-DNA glycosylase [Acidimicrobiales bacterium]